MLATLNEEELHALTGYQQPRKQIEWLRKELGLEPPIGADGRPRISQAMVDILKFVQAHPGAMYEEIADHLGVQVPSVNVHASRLEKVGLVERTKERIGRSVRAFVSLCEGACLDFDVVVVNP